MPDHPPSSAIRTTLLLVLAGFGALLVVLLATAGFGVVLFEGGAGVSSSPASTVGSQAANVSVPSSSIVSAGFSSSPRSAQQGVVDSFTLVAPSTATSPTPGTPDWFGAASSSRSIVPQGLHGSMSNSASMSHAASSAASSAARAGVESSCRVLDFTGSSQLVSRDGVISGPLILRNQSTVSCTVSGTPPARLLGGDGGSVPVTISVHGGASAIVVPSKGEASVEVRWTNWCGSSAAGPFSVLLRFGTVSEYLKVPLLTAGGSPITSPPPCTDRASPSTLTLEPLRLR